MDTAAYLQRVGFNGPLPATVENLTRLQRSHMYSIPFENLDIRLGRPIVLSLPRLYQKIVRSRRGGFCYELNGLFGWLLQRIGFDVQMLSARVFDGTTPGPEFDHMILLVDAGEKLLVDVGFGDSFTEPLSLNHDVQASHGDSYRLEGELDQWVLYRQTPATGWRPQYAFSLQPRQLHDFDGMCHFHQTSPDSSFTTKSLCSLATEAGRVTLSNSRLIVTSGGEREETTVPDGAAYRDLLKTRFGIDLGDEVNISPLLA